MDPVIADVYRYFLSKNSKEMRTLVYTAEGRGVPVKVSRYDPKAMALIDKYNNRLWARFKRMFNGPAN